MNNLSLQIENHEFVKELHNDQIPVIERLDQEIKSSEKSMGRSLSSSAPSRFEEYSTSVFMWAMKIRDCFENLDHAKVYLSYFRTNKRYAEAGIGRSHHINYHYFNYVITVPKVMDIALILTDKTFRLGNPERLCLLNSISGNSWVISAGVDKLLKRLNAVVKPWREPRNLFIHRGVKVGRKPMHILEACEFVTRQDPLISVSPSLIKRLHKSEIARMFKEFEQVEAPLFKATSELLSGLLPIYRSWYEVIKQASNG